jgi:hypothetical protein
MPVCHNHVAQRSPILSELIAAEDLRPPMLDDLGLVPALRWYLERQTRRAGIRVEFFADPSLERLNAPVETACFQPDEKPREQWRHPGLFRRRSPSFSSVCN